VLADLKQYNHAAINYTVDISDLPDGVSVGDTVHLVDEAQGLNLSARLLELKDSYAADTHEATLGDYLIEASQIDPALQALADQMKTLAASRQWYPWTRYADDDEGSGISANPDGKSYMAIVWSDQSAVPSDDAADYAGHWQKMKGDDGIGVVGPKGDDGKTSYFHTAYADDVSGNGLSQSPEGKTYIGTYSDFTEADSVTASDYTWVLIKGADGAKGDKGDKGDTGEAGSKDVPMTYVQTAQPTGTPVKGSIWWVGDTLATVTAMKRWDGTQWVADSIAQSVLNIKELNAVTINSGSLNSPLIKVPFEHMVIDSENMLGSGTMTLDGPKLTLDGTIDGGTQKFEVQMSASGFSSIITGADGDLAHPNQMATLIKGELDLQLAYAGSGANKSYVSSVFDAGAAAHYFKRETVPATANFTNAFIEYARRGNQVTATFHFDLLSETGWVGLEMPPAGYKPESWYVSTDLISTSYLGWRCGIYFNSQGWRLLPTAGQGKGTYQGAVSYTTLDDYPYGDVKY
jgi:hypothetical protein